MLRRAFLALLLGTVAALVAVSPARGDGTIYIVTGTGDDPGATCGPYPGIPGAFACGSLRAAVAAAGANPGIDAVGLGASGTYTLNGELVLDSEVSIAGPNARTTAIVGNGIARVIRVAAGVNAAIAGVTISGGRAGAADGGNIANAGGLTLVNAHVTDGSAANGGGIANTGTLLLLDALVDGNTATVDGGGIFNLGGDLGLSDTTVYNNNASIAGGIASSGSGTQISLTHVTLAFNRSGQDPAGISAPAGTWAAYGSLLIGNQGNTTPSNCDSAASSGTFSIEDGGGCELALSGLATTGLMNGLANLGGHTDVLPIPTSGPAKGFVNPCNSSADQRNAPRSTSCDAGAYEQGAAAPPVTGFELPPVSTPPPPPPTPTPTATPTATPVAGQSVSGSAVEGKVRVKAPGGKFVDLDPSKPIPLGSTIDTKDGAILLTAQQTKGGKPQTAKFYDGIFKITQTKATTDLTLNEALATCGKGAKPAAKKPRTRKLWGDGSGSFRTRGQYSAATVRGTQWLVQDSCAGTLTQVRKGTVSVRDNVTRKTIILRAGKKYLAKPKK